MRGSIRGLIALLLASLLAGGCTAGSETAAPASPGTTGAATDAPREQITSLGRASFEIIPEIVADVAPSVVSIEVSVQRAGGVGQGAGSGVIFNSDGAIVTNDHVVAQANEIMVLLADGERIPAEVVATDPRTDLAVIRVDRSGLPAADFAQRLPQVGQLALALGNPLGLQNSATAGIVSGLDRSVPAPGGAVLAGLIQTDAPISPGNSGGALVDGEGKVIGVNVAKASGAQGAENVGFAIPSTTVVPVVEELLADGEVSHPFLGIRGATLTPQVAERFGIQLDRGVVVAGVEPGSPAEEAGLQSGDVIVELAGQEVAEFGDLVTILRDHEPGETISLMRVRDGQRESVQVTLDERPEQQ